MQVWGLWRSPYGGVILRCPAGQLTVRTPRSKCLYSERRRRSLLGFRFIWRKLGIH